MRWKLQEAGASGSRPVRCGSGGVRRSFQMLPGPSCEADSNESLSMSAIGWSRATRPGPTAAAVHSGPLAG
jgi:hypothetical protein